MKRLLPRKAWLSALALAGAAGLGYAVVQGVGTFSGSPTASTGGPIAPSPPAPVPSPPTDAASIPTEIGDEDDGSATGDVHVRTIDGAFYDLQLVGEFIAAKSTRDDFEIQTRLGPWGRTSKTVSTNIAVAMNVAGDRVGVYVRQASLLHVNGSAVASLDQPLRLPKGGQVSRENSRITVTWPDETMARIDVNDDYLDLSVIPDRARAGTLTGLFGNFDGVAANDLVARNSASGGAAEGPPKPGDGSSTKSFYGRFGDSWRISQAESLFDYGPGEGTSTWTDLNFPYQIVDVAGLDAATRQRAEETCKAAGITDVRFLLNCILDFAVTGVEQFIQSALKTQKDTQLPEGFGCWGLRAGGSRCTDYRPAMQDARVGGKFHISVETMQGDAKHLEEFDCAPIDAKHRAACKFNTHGRVFAGSNTVEQYVAENGNLQQLHGTMEQR